MQGRDVLQAATGAATTGAKIKLMVPAAALFFVLLLVLGVLGGGATSQAYADACGDRGQPGSEFPTGSGSPGNPGQNPGGDFRKQQIANAKIIDSVAEENGLPGRASLIALMTALQESTLINLSYGHLDSIGLFQQRPSQGWGTRDQIMDPVYSAGMFFLGAPSGSPRGLTDIRGWQTMPMGLAAQAVQASAYPTLYAGQESAARQIAADAGIDLDRPGTAGPPSGTPSGDGAPGPSGQPADPQECYTGGGTPSTPGAPFHDGAAGWPSVVENPRSTKDAIEWAKTEAATGTGRWYRLCLAFVARTYGWSYSGVELAIGHYREMPPEMKHDKDRTPPPGALMYWDTGVPAGHVALYLGDGKVASNDILRPGYIDVVPATDIETKWGATYLGWAPPYFPKGG
ncbi:peptidase M23 [Streptomyces sp. NPDC088557]|uniref:peptidase M23 n=1 Tax=Streptomyces sp. NPDC088557 TaxID=3365867 RepID=UPI0037FE9791